MTPYELAQIDKEDEMRADLEPIDSNNRPYGDEDDADRIAQIDRWEDEERRWREP